MKEARFIVCAFLGLLLIFWAGYTTGEENGFQQGYFTRNHPECDIWSKRFNEDFCQDILPMAPVGTLSWQTHE